MSTFDSAFSELARNQDADNKDTTIHGHLGERVTSHSSSPKKGYHPLSPKKGTRVLPDDSSVQAVALERQGLSDSSDVTTDTSMASSIAID
jgi:hypothetical protein